MFHIKTPWSQLSECLVLTSMQTSDKCYYRVEGGRVHSADTHLAAPAMPAEEITVLSSHICITFYIVSTGYCLPQTYKPAKDIHFRMYVSHSDLHYLKQTFFFADTGYFLSNNLRIEHKSVWRCCQSLTGPVTCYLQIVQLHQEGINGAQCPPHWAAQLLGERSQKNNESTNKFHCKTQRLAKWNQENRVQDNKQQWQHQSWVKAFGVWKGSNKSLTVASVLQRICWNVQEWRYRQPAYVTRKITWS